MYFRYVTNGIFSAKIPLHQRIIRQLEDSRYKTYYLIRLRRNVSDTVRRTVLAPRSPTTHALNHKERDKLNKRAMMTLGRSPEYHWNQIISKSVHQFRRSRLNLFSIYSPGGIGLSNFCKQSPKEHSCIIISKSMHWLRRRSHWKVFLFLALAAILFHGAEQFEQF